MRRIEFWSFTVSCVHSHVRGTRPSLHPFYLPHQLYHVPRCTHKVASDDAPSKIVQRLTLTLRISERERFQEEDAKRTETIVSSGVCSILPNDSETKKYNFTIIKSMQR